MTIEDRGRRTDLVEVFKIINGIENINIEDLFLFSTDTVRTRGHNYKLIKSPIRTNIRKHFLHKLSTTGVAVNAQSINIFKGCLHQYLNY